MFQRLKLLLNSVWASIKDDPKNFIYMIIGNVNRILFGGIIYRVIRRSKECPTCWRNGYCKNCGCPTMAIFLSPKKCKKTVKPKKNVEQGKS